MKKKLLYLLPHLSTGGMPQYVLEQIREFKDQFEIFVIEYNLYATKYVVQKNKIIDLLEPNHHICLSDVSSEIKKDRPEVLEVISNIKPDIVHIQDHVKWFLTDEIMKGLLNLKNRPYFIVTPHSSQALPDDCIFIPDKYVLVSRWQYELYKSSTSIPCDIWEYPIKNLKKDKERYQKELNLDPNFYHILNISIFTRGKNQGELFEIARQLKDKPIKFHFIGNQSIHSDYWTPLMENKPENCIVWGEREDTDKFYQACDLFYFSTKLELFPLVVRESLSYKLPIMMKKLHTYLDTYDNNELVYYIEDNIEDNKNKLLNILDI
tara:strand:+ start:218 stop:1183 length:966 start_codon:yes stop_codon:yes gene_type:complete